MLIVEKLGRHEMLKKKIQEKEKKTDIPLTLTIASAKTSAK